MRMPRLSATRRRSAIDGFTTVELLIALVAIGILTAVALPSFNDAIRKSRRSEAFAALAAVQQAQERWRSNNATYTTDLSSSGLRVATSTPGGYYSVAIDSGPTATDYAATATAVSGSSQAADGNCVRLRVRTSSGNVFYGSAATSGSFDESTGNRCWSR